MSACHGGSAGHVTALSGPSALTVLKQGGGGGDIFITAQGKGYTGGPEILTNLGLSRDFW
jgi:hypothetical protein